MIYLDNAATSFPKPEAVYDLRYIPSWRNPAPIRAGHPTRWQRNLPHVSWKLGQPCWTIQYKEPASNSLYPQCNVCSVIWQFRACWKPATMWLRQPWNTIRYSNLLYELRRKGLISYTIVKPHYLRGDRYPRYIKSCKIQYQTCCSKLILQCHRYCPSLQRNWGVFKKKAYSLFGWRFVGSRCFAFGCRVNANIHAHTFPV